MNSISCAARPALYLASSNQVPAVSEKRKLKRRDLRLFVNDEFSGSVNFGAKALASWIESEFMRLTCDCSIGRAASVRLEKIPGDLELELAEAILNGRGMRTEVRRYEARHYHDESHVSVYVERQAHS